MTRLLGHLGRVCIALGMGLFMFGALWGTYHLDEPVLQQLRKSPVVKQPHRAAFFEQLQTRVPNRFLGSWSLAAQVDNAIDDANRMLPDDQKIWDYDRGQYRLVVAKTAFAGVTASWLPIVLWLWLFLVTTGGLLLAWATYARASHGIRNDNMMHGSLTHRGVLGMGLFVVLVSGYVLLYFFPEFIVGAIRITDPLSHLLRNRAGDRWFLYGLLYTLSVLILGVRMLGRYWHNAYQIRRTLSVMFFQTGFAFCLPLILGALNMPEVDLKSAWPLDYSLVYDYRLSGMVDGGALGWALLMWSIALAVLIVPLLGALVGKRWYCSWVCGCGGLAETVGDPFRHLSSKSVRAWRIERWTIHGVLLFSVVMTTIVVTHFVSSRLGTPLLGDAAWRVQQWYGFFIASMFAGVIGTGFYPVMGNRVWCRFGCPLAAVLGIVQRFSSRFRITTNGGQCIACGNCSTYCEMGIDVRWYAQRGQDVVRASCVGCGICAAVCPRGVLRLENGSMASRGRDQGLVLLDSQ